MNIYWTKYSPLEDNVSATDPLALDYMAQQLGYLPLPNFTGRTSRARYYSMVCYGLYICEEIIKRDNLLFHENTITKLFELYEKYWAFAVICNYKGKLQERDNQESGLRGKRGAIKAVNDKLRNLGDDFKLLSRQLELGALGAYRSSLERFCFIKKSSLSLTLIGREMAESFLPVDPRMRKQYNELLLESIRSKKIIEKKGNASIEQFGFYASLDLYNRIDWPTNERPLLKKRIVESDGITLATGKMVFYRKDLLKKSITDLLYDLANFETSDQIESQVKNCFKTIYCFELLSIELNKLFCSIIKAVLDKGGKTRIEDLESQVKPISDNINSLKLSEQLFKSPMYHEMLNYYYGRAFSELISHLNSGLNGQQLIRVIVKLHSEVETNRRSGKWLEIDDDWIVAYSGYDYAKANMNRQHNYKIPNLLSIIDDAGWQP